jgi:hypothetical protein
MFAKKLYGVFLVSLLLPSLIFCREGATQTECELLVEKYMTALRDGDTAAIMEVITGKMLSEKQVLLEFNKGYPRMLKEMYNGSNYKIQDIRIDLDRGEIDLEICFLSGEILSTTFLLRRIDGEGWKVEDEVDLARKY